MINISFPILRFACGIFLLFELACANASNLSLDDLVKLSLQASPAIRSSKATLEGSDAASEQARWMRYPSLSLQAENRLSGSGNYPNSGGQIGTTAKVSMPVWSAGRISAENDAADLRKVSSAWAVEEQREQVAFRTASTWRVLVSSYATTQIDDRVLKLLSDFEAKIQRRINQGLSAPVDLDSVVAKKMQIATERSAATSQMQTAASRLIIQSGSLPDVKLPQDMQDITLQTQESIFRDPLPTADRIRELARTNPVHVKALTDAEAAKREMATAKARLLPELQAVYQYQPSSAGVPASEGIFLTLNYQSGNGLSNLSQVRAALARYESLTETADNSLIDATDAIMSDIQDYYDAVQRLKQTQQAVKKSGEVLESSFRLFDAGKRSVFEILGAITELAQNEKALAPLQAQLIATYYTIGIRLGQQSWQYRPSSP